MKNYKNSDYARNKNSKNIVYHFSDGSQKEITLEEYIKNCPDKTASDFEELKKVSDSLYLHEDRKTNAINQKVVSINTMEETVDFSTNSLENSFLEKEDLVNCIKAAVQLLGSEELTQIQKERFFLYFFQGYSYAQIAQIQCVHPTSVAASIKAVRKKLKQYFENL